MNLHVHITCAIILVLGYWYWTRSIEHEGINFMVYSEELSS